MKTLLALFISLSAVVAHAVPGEFYLVAPKSIKILKQEKKLQMTISLKCKNDYPEEWMGNLVSGTDDEGDMAVAYAIVLATSSCEKSTTARDYVFTYTFKQAGITQNDLDSGITLKPAYVAKENH